MQLKQIARDALLRPLQAVSGIVERRHTLPILANVLLEQKNGKLNVTATDLEMQITAVSDLAGNSLAMLSHCSRPPARRLANAIYSCRLTSRWQSDWLAMTWLDV